MMKIYTWNEEKNEWLKAKRGISFQEILDHMAEGNLLDVVTHPNQEKYGGQRIFVVKIRDYVWLVPFVETEDEMFLKTIIPSRKATRKYLGGRHEN